MRGTNTKSRIQEQALKLFAKSGYDAVGVAQIADAVQIKAPSLYKHYKSKREIFESIIERVNKADYDKAKENDMPEDGYRENDGGMEGVNLDSIIKYAKEMLVHWTEDEFFCNFRRMLSLEQYNSTEMKNMYSQYISAGPLGYMTDVFAFLTGDRGLAENLSLEFYAPMFMMYSLYDGGIDIDALCAMFDAYSLNFKQNFQKYLKGKSENGI